MSSSVSNPQNEIAYREYSASEEYSIIMHGNKNNGTKTVAQILKLHYREKFNPLKKNCII